MDLPALEELLTRLKSLPVAEKSETNIFSVGARGHYETLSAIYSLSLLIRMRPMD